MDYKLDKNSGVWIRNSFLGTNYSDGFKIENYIYKLLSKTKDLSINSRELKSFCKNWVLTYHLSQHRANILRPLGRDLNNLDILEIGSGCGAISRYLGESNCNLTSLEGSFFRAKITRERCRDLKNVKIICDKLDNFQSKKKFDIITIIGVLEYSSLFSNSKDEPQRTLKQIYSLLKNDGFLVIAIENKLGLKYFAGYKEDHIGKTMYGIEDRYLKTGVRTFGRFEINNLLIKSGFQNNYFMYPFPDYKFPNSIITENGLNNEEFDPQYLIALSANRDRQKPNITSFEQIYAWESIYKNKLVRDLSNSFLILCSKKENKKFTQNSNLLAFYYRNERESGFKNELVFREDNKNNVVVSEFDSEDKNTYNLLNDSKNLKPFKDECFIKGRPLIFVLMDILKRDNWKMIDLKNFFISYKEYIYENNKGLNENNFGSNTNDFKVEKDLIDATLWNIIETDNKKYNLFDKEFEHDKDLFFSFLLFRNLYYLKDFIPQLGYPSNKKIKTWGRFTKEVFYSLNLNYSEKIISLFIKKENNFHKIATGNYLFRNFLSSYLAVMRFTNKKINYGSGFDILNLKANFISIILKKIIIKLRVILT
tara:strand:+ start:28151 stop:29932 length:1782 start_codon:yes stop_codon:yes gene_type:complete